MSRLLILVVIACQILCAGLVRADEYLDRANKLYATVKRDLRSDVVLMPALAKMDAPPAAVTDTTAAALLPKGAAAWAAAEAWATAAPQKAAIEALRAVTKERDAARGFAFAQPYGDQAVASTPGGIDLINKSLYTELAGDPPMLAGARFGYLKAIQQLASLINVEATRLAADDPKAAVVLLTDWVYLGRQLADRAFAMEMITGMGTMTTGLERIRDVVYQDQRSGSPKLTADQLLELIEPLKDEGRFLAFDRIMFPRGDRIAAEQMIARGFTRNGPANPAVFAEMMAQLGSSERPLQMFSEGSKWAAVATVHADAVDTTKMLDRVYNDWLSRWPLDPFDRRLSMKTDYQQMDQARYSALDQVFGRDLAGIFNARQVLRTHLVGTRSALALAAFTRSTGTLAPQIASIVPKYLKKNDADPFNPERANKQEPALEYFVPIRDQKTGDRGEKKPHTINVFTAGKGDNFKIDIGSDQFILYSRGPDNAKGWATNVSLFPELNFPGDILLWPPITSLTRQELIRNGSLK